MHPCRQRWRCQPETLSMPLPGRKNAVHSKWGYKKEASDGLCRMGEDRRQRDLRKHRTRQPHNSALIRPALSFWLLLLAMLLVMILERPFCPTSTTMG